MATLNSTNQKDAGVPEPLCPEWREARHPDAEGGCLRSVFVLSLGEEHVVQCENTENS